MEPVTIAIAHAAAAAVVWLHLHGGTRSEETPADDRGKEQHYRDHHVLVAVWTKEMDAEQCAWPIYTGRRKQQHASIWTQIEEIIGTHAWMRHA